MKWIKVAIGAVIAVLSIGIIATTVFKMTQPSEVIREVSFEIDPEEGKYYPISAYNEIVEYGVFGESRNVENLVSSYINNEIAEFVIRIGKKGETDILFLWGQIPIPDGYLITDSYIDANGNWFDDGSTLTDNVNIKLVFEASQPPKLTGSSAILILLIPTVFAGGVLLYFCKPFKKD